MASKVMVCRLHKVGSSGTYQMFSAIVVNRWDTTQTHQNVPTINQVQTKITNQAMGTAVGPTRWEWSKRADVHVLPIREKHPKRLDIAGQSINCRYLL